MIKGIYFNPETRSFSQDPVTGEFISPEKYQERINELGGVKRVGKADANGHRKLALKADTKRNIDKLKKAHDEGVRSAMIAKEASKASNKAAGQAAGKIIGKQIKAGNLVKGADAARQAKIAGYKGAGIAAGATLAVGGAALAAKKIIDKRKADKAAAEKKNA